MTRILTLACCCCIFHCYPLQSCFRAYHLCFIFMQLCIIMGTIDLPSFTCSLVTQENACPCRSLPFRRGILALDISIGFFHGNTLRLVGSCYPDPFHYGTWYILRFKTLDYSEQALTFSIGHHFIVDKRLSSRGNFLMFAGKSVNSIRPRCMHLIAITRSLRKRHLEQIRILLLEIIFQTNIRLRRYNERWCLSLRYVAAGYRTIYAAVIETMRQSRLTRMRFRRIKLWSDRNEFRANTQLSMMHERHIRDSFFGNYLTHRSIAPANVAGYLAAYISAMNIATHCTIWYS